VLQALVASRDRFAERLNAPPTVRRNARPSYLLLKMQSACHNF
jgi:hypothetical protein